MVALRGGAEQMLFLGPMRECVCASGCVGCVVIQTKLLDCRHLIHGLQGYLAHKKPPPPSGWTPRYRNSLKNTGIPVKLRPVVCAAFLCGKRCLAGILGALPRSSNWCVGLMVLVAGKTTLGRAACGIFQAENAMK